MPAKTGPMTLPSISSPTKKPTVKKGLFDDDEGDFKPAVQ